MHTSPILSSAQKKTPRLNFEGVCDCEVLVYIYDPITKVMMYYILYISFRREIFAQKIGEWAKYAVGGGSFFFFFFIIFFFFCLFFLQMVTKYWLDIVRNAWDST